MPAFELRQQWQKIRPGTRKEAGGGGAAESGLMEGKVWRRESQEARLSGSSVWIAVVAIVLRFAGVLLRIVRYGDTAWEMKTRP